MTRPKHPRDGSMRAAFVTLAMLTIGSTLALVDRAVAAGAADVARLAWLEGTWTGVRDGIAMEEHWTSPAGGGLVGMHKDVRSGRMVSFEFLRIDASDSAGVCYLASPRGAPVTRFCAIELTNRRVVFENPTHDFPQRVLYWLDDRGRLHARIEGTIGGQARSEEWTWSKRRR